MESTGGLRSVIASRFRGPSAICGVKWFGFILAQFHTTTQVTKQVEIGLCSLENSVTEAPRRNCEHWICGHGCKCEDFRNGSKKAETLSGAVGHEPRKLSYANRQIRTAAFRTNPARQLAKGTEPDKSVWDETSDSDGCDELNKWRWERGLGECYKSFSRSLPGRTDGGCYGISDGSSLCVLSRGSQTVDSCQPETLA